MKNLKLFIIILSTFILGCNEQEEKDVVTQTTSLPEWSGGYPQLLAGATSADILAKTEKEARLYYVVSTQPLNLSPSQLMKEAGSPSSETVVDYGIINTSAMTEKVQTIEGLKPGAKYYFYLLPQNPADTTTINTISALEEETYIRQDTSEYFSSAENRPVNFLIYHPEEALKYPAKKYPTIIFLGGAGEVAHKNKPINLLRNGVLPDYIEKGNDVPMIVVSIQHTDVNWNSALIEEGINYAISNFPVDESKIYLVGTSAGAFGAIEYAQAYPQKLAALVPISGGGKNDNACALKDMSVWAFHNQHDNIVSAGKSVTLIDAIGKCNPSKEVKLQLFPDHGHNCWRRVFDPKHEDWMRTPSSVARVNLYEWLLQQQR